MTVEAVAKEIHPTMDVFAEARPYFLELLRKRYSPQRIGNEVWRGLEKLSAVAYEMPGQLNEVLDDLRLGRLMLKVSVGEFPHAVDRLGRRLFCRHGSGDLHNVWHSPAGHGASLLAVSVSARSWVRLARRAYRARSATRLSRTTRNESPLRNVWVRCSAFVCWMTMRCARAPPCGDP